MPGDAIRKVGSGQALRIPAAAYNLFIDAAMDYRNRALARESEAAGKDTRAGIVPVRNQTGLDLPQFAVLGLAGLVITPMDNEAEFRSRPAFDAWQPAPGCELAILQAPLAAGAIGPAMVFGVTPAWLNVMDEGHGYAGPASGDTGSLTTAGSGAARVLWKEPGTGLRWSVIRFPVEAREESDMFMPPMFWETIQGDVPAGGSVFINGSTVPAGENWLLIGVTVYVPNNAPCYALLKLSPQAGSFQGELDVAMTRNLPSGHDPDLCDTHVTRRLIVPAGGRLRAYIENGSSQGSGKGFLAAIYLRYPAGIMPTGF